MNYRVQVVFTTDRPLTREEISTLDYAALLLVSEPVSDDGDHADWSGHSVAVTVWEDGEPVR